MLNYLGPSMGPQGPVTNVLPPAQPGTMPSGVPGVRTGSPMPPPMPRGAPHPSMAAGPSPVMQRNAAPPAGLLAAILHHAVSPGGPAAQQPQHPDYISTTQEDGSILLRIKGPHGPGPIVKIIPPIKQGKPAGPVTP